MKKIFWLVLILQSFLLVADDFTVCEIHSSKIGYGVFVDFQNNKYIATPSHVIFSNIMPKVIYQDKKYNVKKILLSTKRDLALLQIDDLNVDNYLELNQTNSVINKDNRTFEFIIEKSSMKNCKDLSINDLQGLSGYPVKYNDLIGLFQGCLVNRDGKIVKYLAINLKNLSDEFRIVKFSLIKADFDKKNLKNIQK